MAGARRVDARLALRAICLFVVAVGLWNVSHYPPGMGYDALDHEQYALGLVPGGHLPHGTGEYYTPPGYYAIAGAAVWGAEQVGINPSSALRVAMSLNVVFLLGTVLLVAAIARELWPGRPRIELAAAAFVALLPVVVEAEAMFHPETASLFLSTLAIWLCVRTLANPRYALALGAALGAAQLVRAFALWTVACVVLTLLVAKRWRTLFVVVVVAAAIPSPWYVHQTLTYGGLPFFAGRPATPQAHTTSGAVKPFYERRPLAFYVDPGLPDLFGAPYRPHFDNLALPETYAGVWGDYFGFWAWDARPNGPFKTTKVFPPPRRARVRLVIQSIVGVLPTLIALAGLLLLARSARRSARVLVVALLPLLALLGFLYFTVGYPTPDGDVIKASYMLTTAAGWAIAFGLALDRLSGMRWRLAAPLLAVAALVDLTFVVYP